MRDGGVKLIRRKQSLRRRRKRRTDEIDKRGRKEKQVKLKRRERDRVTLAVAEIGWYLIQSSPDAFIRTNFLREFTLLPFHSFGSDT